MNFIIGARPHFSKEKFIIRYVVQHSIESSLLFVEQNPVRRRPTIIATWLNQFGALMLWQPFAGPRVGEWWWLGSRKVVRNPPSCGIIFLWMIVTVGASLLRYCDRSIFVVSRDFERWVTSLMRPWREDFLHAQVVRQCTVFFRCTVEGIEEVALIHALVIIYTVLGRQYSWIKSIEIMFGFNSTFASGNRSLLCWNLLPLKHHTSFEPRMELCMEKNIFWINIFGIAENKLISNLHLPIIEDSNISRKLSGSSTYCISGGDSFISCDNLCKTRYGTLTPIFVCSW